MFGSNVLEIAIGVVFTFLTVSLICSALNEMIAGLCRSRARELERGIRNILDGTSRYPLTSLGKARAFVRRQPRTPAPSGWAGRLLRHRLIDALSKDGKRPSYIPARTFVTALKDLIAESNQPAQIGASPAAPLVPLSGVATFANLRRAILNIPDNPQMQQALLALLEEARATTGRDVPDSLQFDRRLQVWYEETMDRVSGWYKLRTRIALFFIGLAVAGLANIDAIRVFRTLSTDSTVRATVVAAANDTVKQGTTSSDALGTTGEGPSSEPGKPTVVIPVADVAQSVGQLNALGIPVGWTSAALAHPEVERAWKAALTARSTAEKAKAYANAAGNADATAHWQSLAAIADQSAKDAESQYGASLTAAALSPNPDNLYDLVVVVPRTSVLILIWKILGILFTAVAASVGAPFWFDLLKRFVSIRTSGKAPEERPADPKKILQPQAP